MSPTQGIWSPPLARLTLGLVLVVAATAFEALAVATILPMTTAELGGIEWYGWTFSAFMLTNLVGITMGGSETDRRGPRRPFVAGTLLFTAGLAVSGSAPAMGVIVAGRAAQGLGAGMLSAVAYASIARAYAVELQPRMLATLSSAWIVPGLLGPGVAGVIAQQAGWRWVFLGLAPLLLVAAVLVVPTLREATGDSGTARQAPRTWSAWQLSLGVCAALVGVGLRSWVAALALLLAGLVVATRALRRLLPEGTLSARPGVPAAVAAMCLLNFAFFGTEAFLPLALSHVRAAPVIVTGLALTAASLSWSGGAWLPVKLEKRVRRRTIVLSGLCALALGIGGTLSLLSPAVPPGLALLCWGLSGLGMGLAFTALSAAILEAAPAGQEGAASASLQLAQVLGAAVATGAGGAIVAAPFAGEPPRLGIALVDLLMLATLGFAIVAARRIGRGHSS